MKQQSLKALQKGIVQFSGDACSLVQSFIHAYMELVRDLP